MNIQLLKLELIEWIARLDNLNTIKQLKAYQQEHNCTAQEIENTALEQALNEGLKDVEEGRIVPHEEAMKIIDKWL